MMDLYVLDSQLRRTAFVENYQTIVWTERYSAHGECEIDIPSTPENRQLLAVGTYLATNVSKRVMMIENASSARDSEGRPVLKLTGPSLENVLSDRIARPTDEGLDTTPKWALHGRPDVIVNQMFQMICVNNALHPEDRLPFYMPGSMVPPGNIPFPSLEINIEMDPMTLYDAIKKICEAYDMGFRILRNYDTSQVYFDVYVGSDRTSAQTFLPPVIFSREMGNLVNSNSVDSMASYKNVAYVYSKTQTEIVYADNVDPTVAGFNRRVMMVKVDDTGDRTGSDLTSYLQERGKEALAEHRTIQALDGEISKSSGYVYDRDYSLGDMVEIRDDLGGASNMRVTEQIFISDAEGFRAYPTLSSREYIMPGSWMSYGPGRVWQLESGTWSTK